MGVDHHKQYSHLTLMEERREEIKSGRVENLRREVEAFLKGVECKIVVAIEASRSRFTMVNLIKGLRVEVKVAHPQELRAIAAAKIKTDKRNSETLAHFCMTDDKIGWEPKDSQGTITLL